MQELGKSIAELQSELDQALAAIAFETKNKKLSELAEKSQAADFWSKTSLAQTQMRELSKLQNQLEPWRILKKQIAELKELADLKDNSIVKDLNSGLEKAKKDLENLKKQLRFSGPYDDHDVLLSIYAGAGGTDAQDWAGMLLRMYTRFAEQNNMKKTVLCESAGDEAGLKSVELEVSGPFAYGKLQGEHGVHRLVRLSPFNADAKRQTSFAKVEILPKIEAPEEMPIDEKDLKIDVFRAGGHGGQSVNTTDSAVRVTHQPTGIVINIQNERSQIQNKETALTILRSKLAHLKIEQHAKKISELKGPNEQAAWGNQIRSYVLHPYNMVKDLRTRHETSNAKSVLDGELNPFIEAYLKTMIK